MHARSAQVGIGERDSRRAWGQQLVVRGQLHSPMGKLVMRVAHVAPIRARCFNSKRTSFHVALELEHVESVDLRSAIRKADAVLPAFAREGQRGHTVKRVARRGRCRLLFLLGVQHIYRRALQVATRRFPSLCTRPRRPPPSPPLVATLIAAAANDSTIRSVSLRRSQRCAERQNLLRKWPILKQKGQKSLAGLRPAPRENDISPRWSLC